MKKQMKAFVAAVLALSLCLLPACSSEPAAEESAAAPESSAAATEPAAAEEPASSEAAASEAEEAADASKVLLVVSFGTSYNDSRDITIGAIETRLQEAYADYEVRRAFTSQIIIDILAERDKLEIDNVTEAMDRLVADGVKEVVIQPTHVMNGFEYEDVVAEVNAYADKFDSLTIGEPLLISDDDYAQVVASLAAETESYNAEGTAIVYMGHGTHHEANATYAKLQEALVNAGHTNIFIGTVEGSPTLDDVKAQIAASGATKVVLLPLMIVAGDHATNDMAGDEAESWKSVLTAEGYEVECVLKGLGEYAGIQELFVQHTAAAMAE